MALEAVQGATDRAVRDGEGNTSRGEERRRSESPVVRRNGETLVTQQVDPLQQSVVPRRVLLVAIFSQISS